jgi:son of sevenless-like protein
MLMTIRNNGILSDQNKIQSYKNYTTTKNQLSATVTQLPEETPRQIPATFRSQINLSPSSHDSLASAPKSKAALRRRSPPVMNGLMGNAPQQPPMYVRALYDYEADDRTSLSFHEGDVIQVITQLESGWWDGVINGVRGWFPSNYCSVIVNQDDAASGDLNGSRSHTDDEEAEDGEEDSEEYEDQYEDDEGSSGGDDNPQLPINITNGDRTRADFWIPQATPDGRLFYFNTETGQSSMELPLESPSSANENGPRNRMNINIPDKTRPPPEMMARGYMQDEEDSEGNSASELEGESLMMGNSMVMFYGLFLLGSLIFYSQDRDAPLSRAAYRQPLQWTR